MPEAQKHFWYKLLLSTQHCVLLKSFLHWAHGAWKYLLLMQETFHKALENGNQNTIILTIYFFSLGTAYVVNKMYNRILSL